MLSLERRTGPNCPAQPETGADGRYDHENGSTDGWWPAFSEIILISNLVGTNFAITSTDRHGVEVVPEPATLLALGAGLLALARLRRNRTP